MNPYGKLPQEQAMQTLIHDTNAAFSELQFHLNKIVEWNKSNSQKLKAHNEPLDSEIFIRIEYMKSKKEALQKAIDEYITKFKNDFNA